VIEKVIQFTVVEGLNVKMAAFPSGLVTEPRCSVYQHR